LNLPGCTINHFECFTPNLGGWFDFLFAVHGDDGEPFLESHHVRPLADGGSDKTTNAVVLCPNCHRRSHLGADRKAFKAGLYAKIPRLVKE
jgi:predicted HNH restriction endonuclease